jgi:hypothetical protein
MLVSHDRHRTNTGPNQHRTQRHRPRHRTQCCAQFWPRNLFDNESMVNQTSGIWQSIGAWAWVLVSHGCIQGMGACKALLWKATMRQWRWRQQLPCKRTCAKLFEHKTDSTPEAYSMRYPRRYKTAACRPPCWQATFE